MEENQDNKINEQNIEEKKEIELVSNFEKLFLQ